MYNIHSPESSLFNITIDAAGIVQIRPHQALSEEQRPSALTILEQLAALLIGLSEPARGITGILYHSPLNDTDADYQPLFKEAATQNLNARIRTLLKSSVAIQQSKTPIVSILEGSLNSIQMAPLLWAHHLISRENTNMHFADCTYGIFPGFGVTVYGCRRMGPEAAAMLLSRGGTLSAQKALESGLVDEILQGPASPLSRAAAWILSHPSGTRTHTRPTDGPSQAAQVLAPVKKKANLRFPGTAACFQIIEASKTCSLEASLFLEAEKYAQTLLSPFALAIMRTMNYGVKNAQRPTDTSGAEQLKKIGIIGAGMMGSGIAYEVARAGMHASLKDTSLALAEKGKTYAVKCCDKQISLGKMTGDKKAALLSLIEPTDNPSDLEAADCIIEAVFEQEQLKAAVIKEYEPLLRPAGIFASNTTSLPISRLAANSGQPEHFIGMHFFSPVDRMPLVEIITGHTTSHKTLQTAKSLALKMQKIPIVVHDSPAFFTSRIFFNYLLEAVTMLLEGIPSAEVEAAAIQAGFAVSPLAVLDEISIPLMIHVYDQLPDLSASQKRCYAYLKQLTDQGREGRKSGKGFYDYDSHTGQKQLWQPEIIKRPATPTTPIEIQKRLLHVMALDTYRCLDEGVLDHPIDGDIGSVLGVGYAAHTGGAISHIDQVGLGQFVLDCDQFIAYGEQWILPGSLRQLASQHFSFYSGFESNWPVR